MKKILIVLGTRPEVIKLASIISELKSDKKYKVFVCNTEQQKELSNESLHFFGIQPDFCLNAMRGNQLLSEVQIRLLSSLTQIYDHIKPDATIIQGDTMTAFCGALISFYNKVPLFHVEAGLRSHDLFEPFPEEALRQMITRVAQVHFVPTQTARENFLQENISSNTILVTGNTVIDAMKYIHPDVVQSAIKNLNEKGIILNNKLVLITVHRRENHGKRLDSILHAISILATKFTDFQFVIPVHPNPNVYQKIHNFLKGYSNIILTEPLNYPEIICVMGNSKLILTDSGGIQEEAPSFGVPILVLRYKTERLEGVNAGLAKLVGADSDLIVSQSVPYLSKKSKIEQENIQNPYGDGQAAVRIKKYITSYLEKGKLQ